MDAKSKGVGEVLSQRNRWDVPIYQRHYTWEARDQHKHPIPLFFDDIVEKAAERLSGKEIRFDHYMGALIFGAAGKPSMGVVPSFDVVDGQQRLTTFQLFFSAVRALALDLNFNSMAEHLKRLILNGDEHLMEDPKSERYKLCPTRYDQVNFEFLVESRIDQHPDRFPSAFTKQGRLIQKYAPKLLAAWHYFYEEAKKFSGSEDADDKVRELRLDSLWRALAEDFKIVTIELTKDDDAQVIFASLNGRGEPLSAMDLVRNDLWHRAKRLAGGSEALYEKHWSKFETNWWSMQTKQGRMTKPRMELFLANFLVSETGSEVTINKLFPEYRHFSRTLTSGGVEGELEQLSKIAPHYQALVDPDIKGELSPLGGFLRRWDVTTAYPLALHVATTASEEVDRRKVYNFIENYVVRRALCGFSSKNFNNNFLRMLRLVKEKGVAVQSIMQSMGADAGESYRMPTDDEIKQQLQSLSVYTSLNRSGLRWLLCELEFASRDKRDVDVTISGNLHIEHILPQSWKPNWPLANGGNFPTNWWEATSEQSSEAAARDSVLHTIGNLALLTPNDNQKLSNGPFTTKKDRLVKSLLKTNVEVGEELNWDIKEIKARSLRLAELAIRRWPWPEEPLDFGGKVGLEI